MGTINIITGSWDVGKTKRLIERYNSLEQGTAGGFASIKVYNDLTGEFLGYSLKRLGTEDMYPLALLRKDYNGNLDDCLEFDRFVFFNKTFRMASDMLENLLNDSSIKTVFLDEIGQIELQGEGFHSIFKKILEGHKDIYIAVNENNLLEFTKKYNIEGYNVL